MDVQPGSPHTSVAAEVLAYLAKRPNAADTLEGVLAWWLPRQRYETERDKIEQALEGLAAGGFIEKTRIVDGTVLYSRARTRDPCAQGKP
jgi:hypothetical protein